MTQHALPRTHWERYKQHKHARLSGLSPTYFLMFPVKLATVQRFLSWKNLNVLQSKVFLNNGGKCFIYIGYIHPRPSRLLKLKAIETQFLPLSGSWDWCVLFNSPPKSGTGDDLMTISNLPIVNDNTLCSTILKDEGQWDVEVWVLE